MLPAAPAVPHDTAIRGHEITSLLVVCSLVHSPCWEEGKLGAATKSATGVEAGGEGVEESGAQREVWGASHWPLQLSLCSYACTNLPQ